VGAGSWKAGAGTAVDAVDIPSPLFVYLTLMNHTLTSG
jgi:hypothetical protein